MTVFGVKCSVESSNGYCWWKTRTVCVHPSFSFCYRFVLHCSPQSSTCARSCVRRCNLHILIVWHLYTTSKLSLSYFITSEAWWACHSIRCHTGCFFFFFKAACQVLKAWTIREQLWNSTACCRSNDKQQLVLNTKAFFLLNILHPGNSQAVTILYLHKHLTFMHLRSPVPPRSILWTMYSVSYRLSFALGVIYWAF